MLELSLLSYFLSRRQFVPDIKHSVLLALVDQCQDSMLHLLLLIHRMSLVLKLAMMLADLLATVAQLQHENL